MKNIIPYLLIILGVSILIFVGIAPIAGVLILLGIAMTIERYIPEKWDS